jgi:hypothetical protein
MLEMKRVLVSIVCLTALSSCSKKVSQDQCDAIVSRYAELVVRESKPDAGPEEIKNEQAREQAAAKSDDAFRNCTSQIEPADYDCAMKSKTADELEKCLE